jgi:hypothetical protein
MMGVMAIFRTNGTCAFGLQLFTTGRLKGSSSSEWCGGWVGGESNSVTPVAMGNCWFGVPLGRTVRKVVGCVEDVELWAPSSLSCPQL